MSEFSIKLSKEKAASLVGFVLLGISAFLPWVWFTYLFGGVVTLSGLQVANGEPGIFALIFAIVGSLIMLTYSNVKRCGYVCIGFAILMLLEVAVLLPQMLNIIKEYPWDAGIGAGFYLCVIASIITFVGGIFLVKSEKTEVAPSKQILITTPEIKYCIKCGAKIPKGALFCPKCGQTVETHLSNNSN
ncbi:MAG: zinc ribbon domain-containing protein [Candidatus Baldrarchaeia archaeon]